jgi:hypothetical protein
MQLFGGNFISRIKKDAAITILYMAICATGNDPMCKLTSGKFT